MKKTKLFLGLILMIGAINLSAQVTTIKGLAVIVEYSNHPFKESTDSIYKMFNQDGFSGWGNQGSVKEYFYTQSNNKVQIITEVVKVTLSNAYEYYEVERKAIDVNDIVDAVNVKYPNGFQGLTVNPEDNTLLHLSILSKAPGRSYAFGFTGAPLTKTIKNNGVSLFINRGNITNYGIDSYTGKANLPEHNTVCHEIGHSIMRWPDHYQTAWSNLGNYCLMASAGNTKQPQMINPALRLQRGWIDNVIDIGHLSRDRTYTVTSNNYNTIHKYENPNNPKEYLLIHPQVYGKYYQQYLGGDAKTDQGLAIYYVDEDEGMDVSNPNSSYFIRLVQADNLDEMHDETLGDFNVRGDFDDLYDNVRSSFPNGTPFRWKDGGEFGLHMGEISAPGATMSFTVYARGTTHIVTSDKNGTISPKGVVAVTSLNPTYTLLPNPGYEVNQVLVNGVAVSVTGNTFTTSGYDNKSITVSYKRKATQVLPSPWNHIDIGTPAVAGFSAIEGGKFLVESTSYDIWGSSDNFRYLYTTLNGDGSIIAKRVSVNKVNSWAKAGLMIRESLNPNSVYSMLMYTPRNYLRVQQRTVTGANAVDNPDQITDLHVYETYQWMKITRSGNLIVSYISRDKINWILMDVETIAMQQQIFVGIAVASGNGANTTIAQFDEVSVISENIKPTVSITSPANNSNFTAPLNTVITVNASDADGSVTKVDFFNGSTLLGTDNTAPYSLSWNNVAAGTYNLTAKATDNLGAFTYHTITVTVTNAPSGPITASAPCGSNNSNIIYELSASQRANATGYNWWFNGSSNGIAPVTGSPFKATLSTGNNFGAGQVCVGVNYSSAPWYASYCISVSKCAAARESLIEEELTSTQAYPNPFTESLSLKLPTQSEVTVYDARGTLVLSTQAEGEFYFGSELSTGVYLVKIVSAGSAETIKVIKE
jgi:M6 family metalloprotease-like protein